MAKNADAKRVKILETAKRRFAHYGLAKTTMAEIAQDLSFSKALLYYYFPDKNRLYAAVLELTTDELVEETDLKISQSKTVQEAMDSFLEARLQMLRDNYNIFEFSYSLRNDMPHDLECVMPRMFDKEIKQVRSILELGLANKELKPIEDIEVVSKIFLISLLGMRLGVLKDYKNLFFPPSKEEFSNILDLQKKLSVIFINGLRV